MNTAQIIRQALYDINAVLQDSTTDPFYKIAPMLTWASIGKNKVEKTLRSAKEDHNFIHLQSGDATFRWCGISYDPSSLELDSATRRYTLPPDLLLLKSIRVVEDATDGVVFAHIDVSDPRFQFSGQETEDGRPMVYFDVVGENTLILSDDPPDAVEVEIQYVPRTGPLQIYSTGTVTLTNGSASVSGGSTAWVTAELRNNLELIVFSDGGAPKIISQTSGGNWVDPSAEYYPVQSIDSNATLTLAGAWLPTSLVGASYILATVPSLPEEHHQSIVDYVAYRALRSRKSQAQAVYKADFGNELAEMRADIQPRQEADVQLIEDWNP